MTSPILTRIGLSKEAIARQESEPERLEAWAESKLLEFTQALNGERIRLALMIEFAYHASANLRAKRIAAGKLKAA